MEEQKEEVSKSNPLSPIASAFEAVERMKIENDRMEANIKHLEEIKSFEVLGGRSEGPGQEKPIVEETAKEYSKRIMSGRL